MKMTSRKMLGILLVFLMLLVSFTAVALAYTPVDGRVRVYGAKDEIIKPENMFAPYAVFEKIPHIDKEIYLNFSYFKESTWERHWSVWVTNESGESRRIPKGVLSVYLPYPSIWSAAKGEYWKWTKTYAMKHYVWEYAFGDVMSEYWDPYLGITVYKRAPYETVRTSDMTSFGPRIQFDTAEDSSKTIWIRIEEIKP